MNNIDFKRTSMNIYYLFFEKETFELITNMYSKNMLERFYVSATDSDETATHLQENIFNQFIKKKLILFLIILMQITQSFTNKMN